MEQDPKIISYSQAEKIATRLKTEGKKIVFKTGGFDVFHVAHLRALEFSKSLGDGLFVGVGNDETQRILKGPERPIFPAVYRAEVLAALACVDYVIILDEPLNGRIDHEKIISLIRPDYYMLPPDDKALAEKQVMAKRYGITIKLREEMKSGHGGVLISTTDIVEKLKRLGQ